MEISEKYIIELKRDEAVALKIILGAFSDLDAKDFGISYEQREALRKLQRALPFDDEEE